MASDVDVYTVSEARRVLAEPLADDALPGALRQLVETRALLRRLLFAIESARGAGVDA